MWMESFPAEHRRDPQGLTTSVCVSVCVCARACAGGVGQRSLWTEDKGCSSWKIRANSLRLCWLVKENWHAKKCLILRIRMSGYVFFCWPGEVPCLPGPIINLVRDGFSLRIQILCSLNQCLLVQRTVGKILSCSVEEISPWFRSDYSHNQPRLLSHFLRPLVKTFATCLSPGSPAMI